MRSESTAESVDLFRAQLRHDLKNPLVCVRNYAEMILKGMAGPVNPTMERYVKRMLDAINRQTSVINSRLGSSISGEIPPHVDPD